MRQGCCGGPSEETPRAGAVVPTTPIPPRTLVPRRQPLAIKGGRGAFPFSQPDLSNRPPCSCAHSLGPAIPKQPGEAAWNTHTPRGTPGWAPKGLKGGVHKARATPAAFQPVPPLRAAAAPADHLQETQGRQPELTEGMVKAEAPARPAITRAFVSIV